MGFNRRMIHTHFKTKTNFTPEFANLIANYSNTAMCHRHIWETFYAKADSIGYLKKHRDYIEEYNFGYGDRPFHYLWKLLVEQMPSDFSFLEIGVFKGQIISLVQLLSNYQSKRARIIGVTPLSSVGDHYADHPGDDYKSCIFKIYRDFSLDLKNTRLIKGFSQEEKIMAKVTQYSPFNIIFIDGCHDYEVVVSDLAYYSKLLKSGGFLVLDDASNFLKMPDQVSRPGFSWYERLWGKDRVWLFHGFEDVSLAAKKVIEPDNNFIQLFACGHDRVWLKLR